MPAVDQESSSRVTLRGPGDWKRWLDTIKKKASIDEVWDFIDPSKDNKEVITTPVKPTFSLVNPRASDFNALTDSEVKRLDYLDGVYQSDLRTYRDRKKALSSIQTHITNTVGDFHTTIENIEDIATQLSLLQARVKPSDWALEQDITKRYYDVLKSLDRKKTSQWISNWQKILTEAKKANIPDVQGFRPTRHFIEAVRKVNPAFSDFWTNTINQAEGMEAPNWKDTIPDGVKISEIFIKQPLPDPMTERADFPSFQGSPVKPDTQKKAKSPPKCLCTEKHWYFSTALQRPFLDNPSVAYPL